MIFNLVWLPARQTGSSTRTKVLLRIMLRDTTVCEDDLVKQALRACLTDSPGGLLRSVKRRSKCGQTKIVRNTRVMGDAIRATCGMEYHRTPVQGLLYLHCRYA